MKARRLIPLILTLAALPLAAAPRIVVSTPSLVPESKVDIVFDQPMVGQEALGKTVENDLIVTRPALPAKLFWKAPTIAEFQPQALPQIGTEYRFFAAKGLKHLDGTVVEAGEFATTPSSHRSI
ncbi:MAG: hypothetical protein OSA84_04865 [Akkermansiaceae bacterium]|nr:hypothetical protein [Akkermansiaceae bacterium]